MTFSGGMDRITEIPGEIDASAIVDGLGFTHEWHAYKRSIEQRTGIL